MVQFVSDWAEQLVIAVIIGTILEMLLPEDKNKKYIKMVIGIYVLFCIISPFTKGMNTYSIDNLDLSKYEVKKEDIDQTSMDNRLEELYIEELKKDIIKKVEEEEYKVVNIKVDAVLNQNKKDAGIKKIVLEISENKISNIEEVKIDIGNKNEKMLEENDKKNEKDEVKKLRTKLSTYYEMDEKKIIIYLK